MVVLEKTNGLRPWDRRIKVDWDKKIDTVKKMLDEGYTQRAIAERFGVHPSRLNKVIKQYGIGGHRSKTAIVKKDRRTQWLKENKLDADTRLPDKCPVLDIPLKYMLGKAWKQSNVAVVYRNKVIMSRKAATALSDFNSSELEALAEYKLEESITTLF